MELEAVCRKLTESINNNTVPSDNPFLADLRSYCEWFAGKPDTAYVFLLRDAFLPYLYCKSSGQGYLYPWIINREFLREYAGEGADDLFRLPVYEALERDISDYRDFCAFCKVRIRKVLSTFPLLERTLRELLCGIGEKKILVIESGYCGTIPLMLSALDERVDFRLYTTAPFLYEIYRDKIFCRRYEQIRSFETLYAQDALMKYSSFRKGKFYVQISADNGIWEKAAGEVISLQGLNKTDL